MHPDLSITYAPAVIPELGAKLWKSATGVLDANWTGDHTAPSRSNRHQWSWDTAFIAIGLAYVNQPRAWRNLRSLFEAQWPDGRVPHVVFDPAAAEDGSFPGPEFWNVPAYGRRPAHGSTGLVQPPLHALAVWEVYRHAPAHGAAAIQQARTELEWLYPRLVAQQVYFADRRDAGGSGLAAIVHPWESDPYDSDACSLDLAMNYRDGGYSDTGLVERHPFVVECPGFNAILGTAELALAQIARVLDRPADAQQHCRAAQHITKAIINRLWDADTEMFQARDVRTGRRISARSANALLPLILPHLPTGPHVEALMKARGPIRTDVNWLLRRGMLMHGFIGPAEETRRTTLRLVHDNGSGLGAAELSGTAALCLDLLAD